MKKTKQRRRNNLKRAVRWIESRGWRIVREFGPDTVVNFHNMCAPSDVVLGWVEKSKAVLDAYKKALDAEGERVVDSRQASERLSIRDLIAPNATDHERL